MEFMNLFAGIAETITKWGFSQGLANVISEPGNPTLVGVLVKMLFEAIGNYGWAVILFTVILKLVTSPLDFWQRYSMKKNAKVMEELSPMMVQIEKAYPNDKNKQNQEKNQLYKKYGYSMAAGCFPMIVTMVIFFIMFGGLNSCSTYVNLKVYYNLSETYTQTLAVELDKYQAEYESQGFANLLGDGTVNNRETYKNWLREKGVDESELDARTDAAIARLGEIREEAQSKARIAVGESFKNEREGFLWITNISRPDTWVEPFPESDTAFTSSFTKKYRNMKEEVSSELYKEIYAGISQADVGHKVGSKHWNGLLILPILTVGFSFLTTFITNRTNKKKSSNSSSVDQNAAAAQSTNKAMMFFMPVLMGVFGFIYTATFAVYMVCSSILSILLTLAMNPIIDKKVAKMESKIKKPDYRRR